MTPTNFKQESRRSGKTFAGKLTSHTAALAGRLEAGVSKRALAEALATTGLISGLMQGQTAAQAEADLMAELRHYEAIAALRRQELGNRARMKS